MIPIPTGHENLEGRRWPWVTIAIIVLNLFAFILTQSRMEEEAQHIYQTKIRMVMLEAYHPYVEKPPAAAAIIEHFKTTQPKLWEQAQREDRALEGEWDLQMRMYEGNQADEEMARLSEEMEQNEKNSFLEKYAFFAYKRAPVSYITYAFLHAGLLHLAFNMWFLWLAGTVLEDAWGRIVYPIFYFAAAAVACQAQALATPGSMLAMIGASGAVAGLMGAFLVRYFKTKIRFVLFYVLGFVPRFFRFQAPAYVMLPLWLALQFFSASLVSEMGSEGGVAYWAHIGGFLFGTVVALGLKFSGVEKKVDAAIDGKVGWSADPRVVEAGEIIVAKPDRAIELLTPVVAEKPDLIDAWSLLERAYWQKQDFENYRTALATLARLHIKQKDFEAALQNFEDFRGTDEKFPAAEWMQLIRWFEGQQNWERAAAEYESYAKAHPADRMAVYSLVSAARIHLKNLNNKSEAARLYHAAQTSPVPHLDWEDAINRGLREATA